MSLAVHHASGLTAVESLGPESLVDRTWPEVSPYVRASNVLSRMTAFLLLIPALPLLGFLIVLVRLTSPGPGIYCQERVGFRGRRFTMYKIRTMRVDAESHTGAVWAAKKDPRTTTVGRVLRALHLDEIPQLFNMLNGEMALIGPRPERPEFVRILSQEIPHYLDRLAVLPGITGLAQVNLPPDTDIDSVRRKLVLDLDYIEHSSAWLDFRIALRTMLRLFNIKGDRPSEWLGLYRHVDLTPSATNAPLGTVYAAAMNGHANSNGHHHGKGTNGHASKNGSVGSIDQSLVDTVDDSLSESTPVPPARSRLSR